MTARAWSVLLLLVAACTATGPRLVQFGDSDRVDIGEPDYSLLASYEFAPERVRSNVACGAGPESVLELAGERPRIGVALAGGGTRAAAFAMGALRGLYDQGILQRTDVISSVSGGSYAAYFYFTKLLALDAAVRKETTPGRHGCGPAPTNVDGVFADCLPPKYQWICTHPGESNPPQACRLNDLDTKLQHPLRICQTEAHWVPDDPYRFQAHVRGFVNPLSDAPTFDHPLHPNVASAALAGTVLLADVPKAPALALTNIAFDERVTSSSLRDRYREGIARTYGAMPSQCARDGSSCAASRPVPSCDVRPGLCELGAMWKRDPILPCGAGENGAGCKVPLWVINTTVDFGFWTKSFDFAGKDDLELTTFEITPLGMRSRLYGDHRGLRPTKFCDDHDRAVTVDDPDDGYWTGLSMEEAVAASAAFLDDQQRDVRTPRPLTRGLASLFGINWGYDVENQHVAKRVRVGHRLLPFPLYLAHRYSRDEHAVEIHLGDGGQAENVGLWALLRRQVRNIIVVDSGADREGRMYDLCRVAKALADRGLELRMPSLDEFSETKDLEGKPEDLSSFCRGSIEALERMVPEDPNPRGFDPFQWPFPVVEGCVVDRERARTLHLEGCNVSPPVLWSHLFLIKPAGDFTEQGTLGHAERACAKWREHPADPEAAEECERAIEHPAKDAVPLPTELAAYLAAARSEERENDGKPTFPQHGTTTLTLDANSAVFGAYRELARWDANHLVLDENGDVKLAVMSQEQERKQESVPLHRPQSPPFRPKSKP